MINSEKIILKKAEFSDIEFLWYLRNQKDVRNHSRNQKKIKWQEHIDWVLPILLGIKDKQIFIIKIGGTSVGQIRFDYKGQNEAEISIAILKDFWGKGFASKALIQGIKKEKNIKRFTAEIYKNNLPSIRLFEKMGFVFKEKEGDLLKYNLIKK